MYGLLSQSYKNYRIKQDENKEGYRGGHSNACMLVSILEAMFTVIVLLCAFDIFMVEKFEVIYLALLLFSFYIPMIGELIALGVVVYWVVNMRERSVLFSK